ncbi:MAG: alpha/beta fold hydrolase [Clostridia bacterium]|nr:alpha/beta fold hydrolase [Clostridia bacterium]
MKKALSVVLALCIALSLTVPAFAAQKACDCGDLPIVLVSGMGVLPFTRDAGTPQAEVVFPPHPNIAKCVLRGLRGLFMTLFTFDVKPFADAAADIALDMLLPMACDADGNSLYNVAPQLIEGAMSEQDASLYEDAGSAEFAIIRSAVQAVDADHVYYYNFDWRLDPMTNADDLKAYVDRVLRETGHEKVRLAACSMGGVQTMAYLEKYGHDKVDTIWFLSAAFCGLLFVTNVFSGELQFSQESFFGWLQTLEVGSEKTDKVFDKLMGWCAHAKLFAPLFSLTNKLSDKVNSIVIDRVIRKTLSTMPGMWSFVRDERYEEDKKATLPLDASETFVRRIDDYHYNVSCRREEILNAAAEDGVQIVVISHYNNGCVPVTSSALAHGDSLIETTCSSGGATVADYGYTLPEGYVQQGCKEHNHLSADGVIDASTCMFPDSTWFIKNMAHVGCNKDSDYAEMLRWMFAQKTQPTVFSDARYPQFLQTDAKTQMTLSPVE